MERSAGLTGDNVTKSSVSGIHQLINFLHETNVDSLVKSSKNDMTNSGAKMRSVYPIESHLLYPKKHLSPPEI